MKILITFLSILILSGPLMGALNQIETKGNVESESLSKKQKSKNYNNLCCSMIRSGADSNKDIMARITFGALAVLFFVILGIIILRYRQSQYVNKMYDSISGKVKKQKKENPLFFKTASLIKNIQEMAWPQYRDHGASLEKAIKENMEMLRVAGNKMAPEINLSFREEFFCYYFCEEKRLKEYLSGLAVKDHFKDEVDKIKAPSFSKEFGENLKADFYNENSKEVQASQAIISHINKSLVAIDRVQVKIRQAQSSISSAETMETFDLVSKSTGVSVLSSLSTSDANSDLQKVEATLGNLKSHLNNLNMKKVHSTPDGVDDSLDLVFDLVFDTGFDFLSLMNLGALSSASNNLDKTYKEVNSLESELRRARKKAKEVLKTELDKLP